ncbi:MAG: glycosyltransferase family 39 protein, partial [Anaerolineales bacterium]|nr:glycosyltransferase family 39 protein [Anaerolineales bacterium]
MFRIQFSVCGQKKCRRKLTEYGSLKTEHVFLQDGRLWRRFLPLALLLALALRLPGLFANRFFADEALFATWARLIATWRDPLLLTQAVDKPPLAVYLQALAYPMQGPVEWAARLPNFAASLLLLPLTALLAWRLYRSPLAAAAAAGCVALSPYAIQFAPTAFLDPLLTTWLAAAAVAMTGRRPAAAGALLGLALLTKYQALLFVPLLFALACWQGWERRAWRRALAGTAVPLAALLAWSAARGGGFGLWTAQMRNYGGLRLAWSWELWPRAQAWLALWPPLLGHWLLALAFAAGLGWLLRRAWRRLDAEPAAGVDLLLILFLLGYQAAHWLL